jgi:hypothetical protein
MLTGPGLPIENRRYSRLPIGATTRGSIVRWGGAVWVLTCLCCGLMALKLPAAEPWQNALGRMPLKVAPAEFNRTNCIEIMLRAFQSNQLVKALIFMPGATDEFYLFRRANPRLGSDGASLLDAVKALTNQTEIRATFQPPFLLLHSDEDPLDPLLTVEPTASAKWLRQVSFPPQVRFIDRDWNFMQPILVKALKADVQPWPHSAESWHFYRHSLAAWNLTNWEALQAIALAGKTRVTIRRHWNLFIPERQVVFSGDERVRSIPRLGSFPR